MKGPLKFLDFINSLFFKLFATKGDTPEGFSLGAREPIRSKESKKMDQPEADAESKPSEISSSLETNLSHIKEVLSIPTSTDMILREFEISAPQKTKAFLVFIEGLASSLYINQFLLEPLMVTGELVAMEEMTLTERIEARLVHNNQLATKTNWDELIDGFLTGMTLLFIDGLDVGFLVESKGWEHRTVNTPITEQVVRGPQEAFTEHIRVNTALIRRRLRTPKFIIENIQLGRISRTSVALMYIDGIVNPKIVNEARRRLTSIDVDYVPDSGYIEQYIEDRPLSLFPQTGTTERPDRVASHLVEGSVGVMCDGSPFVVLLPAIFTTFFQSPEDYYLRYSYGLVLRLVRIFAMFLALFLPSIFVAITTFHPEMLPTPLLYAIAASRENLPFPLLIEMLLLEFGFELIREAGVRVPTAIGTTIGIVGALVLGQAAVSAAIVGPILIIVVAITALGSFAVPSFAASFSLRVLRFPLILLGGTLGFFGLAAGAFAIVLHLVSLTSFGVPFMSTIAPARPSRDVAVMGPLFSMEKRPLYLRPLDIIRQRPVVRSWDPSVRKKEDSRNSDS